MNFMAAIPAGNDIQPARFVAIILIVLLSLSIHEFAHAKMADLAGDPTPRFYGRVTMNPLKHLDPFGTIMIIFTSIYGIGIGWGKPVPMDPRKMKNPRWDHFAAVAAGPLSNLLQAIVYALLFRGIMLANPAALSGGSFLQMLLLSGVMINLGLCFFNLIPMGPLDGMWLLGTFLPAGSRDRWARWNLQAGSLFLLILILVGQTSNFSILSLVLWPLIDNTSRFLIGV
jgi:Zn-dependent protease